MKYIIPLIAVTLLYAIPALAQKDFRYLIDLKSQETKIILIDIPDGNSDLEIADLDHGSWKNSSPYIAQVITATGNVVLTCSSTCVGHIEHLSHSVKAKISIQNNSNKLLSMSVWVHPSK